MLDRLKHVWNDRRKLCYFCIAALLAFGAYIGFGQDINPTDLVNKACEMIGGC
jgi:hypothetical protein